MHTHILSYLTSAPPPLFRYLANMNPIEWADESFSYVRSTVYNFSDDLTSKYSYSSAFLLPFSYWLIYFNIVIESTPKLGDAYYKRNLPIVQQRLIAGGVRLGQILNTVLTGSAFSKPSSSSNPSLTPPIRIN